MKRFPLVIIVIAQFLGTSLWFSANGVVDSLAQDWGITLIQIGLSYQYGTVGVYYWHPVAGHVRPG